MAANPIPINYRDQDLSHKRFYSVNFSGQNLSKCKIKGSLCYQCNFDDADLSEADCEGTDFTGSTFLRTNCYRANFRDASLAATVFEPKDAFGITVTLQCRTFQDMRVSALWWFGWLIFGTAMHPTGTAEPVKDNLIAAIGAERYAKLKSLFLKREL